MDDAIRVRGNWAAGAQANVLAQLGDEVRGRQKKCDKNRC